MGPYIFDNDLCLFLLTAKFCAVVFRRHVTIRAGEAFLANANVRFPHVLHVGLCSCAGVFLLCAEYGCKKRHILAIHTQQHKAPHIKS